MTNSSMKSRSMVFILDTRESHRCTMSPIRSSVDEDYSLLPLRISYVLNYDFLLGMKAIKVSLEASIEQPLLQVSRTRDPLNFYLVFRLVGYFMKRKKSETSPKIGIQRSTSEEICLSWALKGSSQSFDNGLFPWKLIYHYRCQPCRSLASIACVRSRLFLGWQIMSDWESQCRKGWSSAAKQPIIWWKQRWKGKYRLVESQCKRWEKNKERLFIRHKWLIGGNVREGQKAKYH